MKTLVRKLPGLAMTAPLSMAVIAAPAVMMPLKGWSQTIEEVTVTARRREENAQEIPVAVASFDADFLEKQGVINTKDVLNLVPGVNFDQSFSSNDTRIGIRGINSSRGRTSARRRAREHQTDLSRRDLPPP